MTMLAAAGLTPTRIAGKGLWWYLSRVWRQSRPAVFAVFLLIGAVKVTNYVRSRNRRKRWNSVGEDVVVLHMFPRGRFCPNVSPFVLKLETYLRMANIQYQVDIEEPLGPKGKSPWITLNGEEIADSQFIMETLGPKYDKDFSAHLTLDQKAVGLSMRIMVEEHLFWCLTVWRFVVDESQAYVNSMILQLPLYSLMWIPLLKRHWKELAKKQGIGRHSLEEIQEIGTKELLALSSWLGDKQYFMGDEPTEVDCAIFGMLAQIQWNSSGSPYLKMLEGDFKNLSDYCLRVKEKFWPDWNQCLNPSQSLLTLTKEEEIILDNPTL